MKLRCKITIDSSLEEAHAKMRERDLQRIESGEATPEQIQTENALLRKPRTWSLPHLTV